jgi:putative drug exporter of the RND superfamily
VSSVLRSVATFSARRRVLVIGVWLVLLAGIGVAGHLVGSRFSSEAVAAGSDSAAANEIMARSFSKNLPDASPIVFHVDSGTLAEPGRRSVIEASLKELQGSEHVATVSDPFAKGSPSISADGRTAFATVLPAQNLGELSIEEAQSILDAARGPAEGAGMEVNAGGQLGTKLSKPATHISDIIGIGVAMVILLLVFGTVTAMALPIAVAIAGVFGGLGLISLFGHLASVPEVAPTVATMIGLGVGIDYSLFIVTRARAVRYEGMSVPDAIGHAAATSGTAVAFAGGTVILALLALAVSGIGLIGVLGQAAAIVVLVALLASATLLPALLGFCGDGIERLQVGRDRRSTLNHSRRWLSWGQRLSRRPGLIGLVCIALLLVIASPVLKLKLGLTDSASSPESTTVRKAYDQLTAGFGPGANGPLLVMADLGPDHADGAKDPQLAALYKGLVADRRVQAASPPEISRDGTAALIKVIPTGSPTSEATSSLVSEARDSIIPASGAQAHIGGSTAQLLDLATLIGRRLPLIIAVVVGLSMLLLLVAFRSVVAPLLAACVNLLAVGGAYGVLTAVFQEGHGVTRIGLDGAIPIVSYVPMMMFAILFGLAMDYQVFLLSRVREELDAGKSAREAVIDGLAGAGKVIASAAAIMFSVFASFILNGDPTVKEFGVGLASAILIAGSMVCVLLPAAMLVLGRATWWLPAWLDRLLPSFDLEGGTTSPGPTPEPEAAR